MAVTDSRSTYLGVLKNLHRLPEKIRATFDFGPGEFLDIGHAGYRARRWVKYCDHYLQGGPAFEQFLQDRATWRVDHHRGHRNGPCLTTITIKDKIYADSRTCQFAPVGILDFKLLGMLANRLDKPVHWRIEELTLYYGLLVSVAHLIPKRHTSFWLTYAKNRTSKYHRFANRYHDPRDMLPEDVIRGHFTFSTLPDLERLTGTKLSTRLRSWRDPAGWIWNTHPPGMIDVLQRYINPFPDLADIAQQRAKLIHKPL